LTFGSRRPAKAVPDDIRELFNTRLMQIHMHISEKQKGVLKGMILGAISAIAIVAAGIFLDVLDMNCYRHHKDIQNRALTKST
jgi:hypothetical protein